MWNPHSLSYHPQPCGLNLSTFIHSCHLWPKSPLSSLLWQGLYLFSERPTNPSSLHCLPLSLLQFTRLLRHGKSIQSKMFPLSSYQTGILFAHFTFTAQIQFCISAHISLSFVVRFIWSIFSGSSGTLLSGSFGTFFRFIWNMANAFTTAFGTGSSSATLPVTIALLEEKNEVKTSKCKKQTNKCNKKRKKQTNALQCNKCHSSH